MTDEDLKRMLGMNAPLETLSPVEFDALSHRIGVLRPDERLQVEAILRRDLQSLPALVRKACQGPPANRPATNRASDNVRIEGVKTFALVFIALHSFAVTIVLLHLLHR